MKIPDKQSQEFPCQGEHSICIRTLSEKIECRYPSKAPFVFTFEEICIFGKNWRSNGAAALIVSGFYFIELFFLES